MASMLLIPCAVNGSCIITLRSVFVQGIQVLDTLPLYIYYQLLVHHINIIIDSVFILMFGDYCQDC